MESKKILFLENDPLIAQTYVEELVLSGFKVDWVKDGALGLSSARDLHYDLVILDTILPKKNALEFLNSLKSKEDLIPHTKIVILTNYELPQKDKEVLSGYAEAYLVKQKTTPLALANIVKNIFSKK